MKLELELAGWEQLQLAEVEEIAFPAKETEHASVKACDA